MFFQLHLSSRKRMRIFAILLLISCLQIFTSARFHEEYINVLGGTDSKIDFSHGNTLPLLGRPWGFNTWSVQSNLNEQDGWWFHPNDRRFLGIRNTKQPSPWINDYGQFLMTASMPDLQHASEKTFWSGYNPKTSIFTPYYFKTNLLSYGTAKEQLSIEFTPTEHAGIMRAKFPSKSDGYVNSAFDQRRRISIILNGGNDSSLIRTIDGTTYITGVSTKNSGGVPEGEIFKHYFVAAIYFGADGADNSVPIRESHADSDWAWISVDPEEKTNVITVRVATSFISEDQALLNLERQAGVKISFEDVVNAGRNKWRQQVSKMTLSDVGSAYSLAEQEDLKTIFYSAQYRASLFPRQLSEIDKNGQVIHKSFYDPQGGVYPGPLSADSGFWDAYSTLYPLHSLVNRNELGAEMITGWLHAYKEGGWLPKWSSPGYRTGMVGTMADVTIADAIIKNIPGFDHSLAYQAIRKNAFDIPPEGVEGIGRVCLEGYLQYGMIPSNGPMTTGGTCYETVSRTLNYMQSDWAIAQAATLLGFTEDAQTLIGRAGNFSQLFNAKSGFFQSKAAEKGKELSFNPEFDQFAWGGDYTEGGPWQYRFYLPYNPRGLAQLYSDSGRNMCDELRSTMSSQNTYHIGAYTEEIHEQTELAESCWGQYEHNNQPVHHMLYMFAAIDAKSTLNGPCAASGQFYLRRAMTQLYKAGTDMFSGDEDNGQMSAWFLLSSIGLYSLSPGSINYNLGAPLFARVEIELDKSVGKKLVIEAKDNSPQNLYVSAAYWNGVPLTDGTILYESLMEGGTLAFQMTDKPITY